MQPSDAELMARVQADDEPAFTTLVERYRPRLLRFARNACAGDPSVAEDLVQETLLAVYTARNSYDPRFAFSTWVWTILLNACRRERRRRQSRWLRTIALAERVSAEQHLPPGGDLLLDEQAQQLRRLLEALPAPQADALRLRFMGGLPFDQIAAAMNSSVSGAKARVRKGLLALAARLTSDPTQLDLLIAASPQEPAL